MRRFSTAFVTLLLSIGLGVTGCNAKEPGKQTVSTQPAPGQAANPTVLIETNKGNITIELFANNAPITTANFLKQVENGFYNGTIFHRVIPGFMIQGGGMLPDMTEKERNEPIRNEANNGLKNLRGTLAMARTMEPHSATTQFFINVSDNYALNHRGESIEGWGYAVFGQVISGMEVADAIVAVQRGRVGPHDDVPLEPVVIKKMSLIKKQ